jgi:hypothetical protein
VWALAVDAQEALLDYLESFYNLRRAGTALRKMGAVDFATTIAPGLRDVLLTGKAVEVVRRKEKNGPDAYDAVILDAPPTGRISQVPQRELGGVGTGQGRADPQARRPRHERHRVSADARPPRHPARGDARPGDDRRHRRARAEPPAGGRRHGQHDQASPAHGCAAAHGRARHPRPRRPSAAALGAAGLSAHEDEILPALLAEASDHAQRVALERREMERIEDLDLPTFVLPLLSGGIDLGGLYELADILTAGGVR